MKHTMKTYMEPRTVAVTIKGTGMLANSDGKNITGPNGAGGYGGIDIGGKKDPAARYNVWYVDGDEDDE